MDSSRIVFGGVQVDGFREGEIDNDKKIWTYSMVYDQGMLGVSK
jgi:hypothetical protein